MSALLTSGGLQYIISCSIAATVPSTASYINWGSGTNPVSTASVSISNETGSRVAASSSFASGGIAACWSASCTTTYITTASDVALFTCSTSGTNGMILYGNFTPIPLESGDRVNFLFSLKLV